MSNVTVENVLVSNVEAAALALKTAQAALVASLQVAKDISAIITVARSLDVTEAQAEEAKKVKDGFRITEEQKDQIAAAKVELRTKINTPEVRAQLMEDIKNGYLKSAQRKLRADGRTVTTIKAIV